MLYIGSAQGLPTQSTADLSVEPVEETRVAVMQWFTQPVVQFLGAHTGCSCGFPSVITESPMDYYDGMWPDSEDRANDLRSAAALIQLLPSVLTSGQPVELFPVWDGDEGIAPKGVVEWSLERLHPPTFFFNEHFMHVVTGSGAA